MRWIGITMWSCFFSFFLSRGIFRVFILFPGLVWGKAHLTPADEHLSAVLTRRQHRSHANPSSSLLGVAERRTEQGTFASPATGLDAASGLTIGKHWRTSLIYIYASLELQALFFSTSRVSITPVITLILIHHLMIYFPLWCCLAHSSCKNAWKVGEGNANALWAIVCSLRSFCHKTWRGYVGLYKSLSNTFVSLKEATWVATVPCTQSVLIPSMYWTRVTMSV